MSDMERGRLVSQHGPYSQVVADYDRDVATKRQSEQFWREYNSLDNSTVSSGSSSRPNLGTGGQGDMASGLAVLVGAVGVLFGLYAAWLFAVEAATVLTMAWGRVGAAVLRPWGPGNALLIVGFLLSMGAQWMVLHHFTRYRSLHWLLRKGIFLLALPLSQVLLWLVGTMLLLLPLTGSFIQPIRFQIMAGLPPMALGTGEVATTILGAVLFVFGVPLIRLACRVIYRSILFITIHALSLREWLVERRLVLPTGIAAATLLMLGVIAAPTPPLSMPFNIWVYPAIIVGALFGWRIALVAAVLAILIGQPGYQMASEIFPDGSSLRRLSLWWGGFIATAIVAGTLRPTLPSSPGSEIRMAVLATLAGLVAGCLTMLVIELVEVGTGNMMRLVADFWFDFGPRYAVGYAASAGIGAIASLTLRNTGFILLRCATART